MKNNSIFLIAFLMPFLSVFSQIKKDSLSTKTNPIVFLDAYLGYAKGKINGITVGASLHFQTNNNLFTFRFLQNSEIEKVDFIIFIPIHIESNTAHEFSLLYGKRFIDDDFTYHFSGGFSYNTFSEMENNLEIYDTFVGFPFEFGISWFKSKKERYRIFYGLIPVGKPTSFGRSFGLKLYGNFSKRSYVGLGLTFGIGWHKKYLE